LELVALVAARSREFMYAVSQLAINAFLQIRWRIFWHQQNCLKIHFFQALTLHAAGKSDQDVFTFYMIEFSFFLLHLLLAMIARI
jgi:hypothetical protein